jgi:hypothetical protein
MAELEARSRTGRLTHAESERLGYLIAWEQRRAVDRPARIARLQRELDLLLTLETAQRGAVAVRDDAPAVDMTLSETGSWSAPERQAA